MATLAFSPIIKAYLKIAGEISTLLGLLIMFGSVAIMFQMDELFFTGACIILIGFFISHLGELDINV